MSQKEFLKKNITTAEKTILQKVFFDAFLLIILRLAFGRCLKSKAETWTLFLMNYPCFGHELLVNCSKMLGFRTKKRGFSGVFLHSEGHACFYGFFKPL
ncbi:MAG: hypothetical protein K6F94_02880 [Bacteroidaceae bacterium]|nr:hypothetical protein [Bacteroidaceae bacterium]